MFLGLSCQGCSYLETPFLLLKLELEAFSGSSLCLRQSGFLAALGSGLGIPERKEKEKGKLATGLVALLILILSKLPNTLLFRVISSSSVHAVCVLYLCSEGETGWTALTSLRKEPEPLSC